jgi:myo-inositol-1(or 4)-monophosphatase
MLENQALAREIEAAATRLAREAGAILGGYFGRQLTIEYKDKGQRDPVTSADKACQEYLVGEIARRFPDHGILAEEGPEDDDTPAPDILWVLDPLDGTTNFLNGLPIYAASIGVLYRGWPWVGAVYIPWPQAGGGMVLHCRRGGGCFADDVPVLASTATEPGGNRLVALPGAFAPSTRFSRKLRGKMGDIRSTGSIAYELALTACGVMQYTVIGVPRIWDVAGGVLAVLEGQGAVVTRFPKEKRWHSLESLVPTWEDKPPSLKELRHWMAPLVAGNRQVAPLIANNLRRPAWLPDKVRRLSRYLRPRSRKPQGTASSHQRPTSPPRSASSGSTGSP